MAIDGRFRNWWIAVLLVAGCGAEPEAPGGIRNVVLVSLDAVGARHVGAYGYERDTTPNLDAVAADGVVFEAAYTQQPWTLTSHLTMMNGLNPRVHGASKRRPASPAAEPLAERLGERGFETAAFVSQPVLLHPRFGHARGFDRYAFEATDAQENVALVLEWLAGQAAARAEDPMHRFFLFVHYYDAHSDAKAPLPYYVPPPYRDRYVPDGETWGREGPTSLLLQLRRSGSATPRDREFLTAYYDAGVRYVDEEGLGPILRALDELGLAEETLLVVTSDHGEEIFEHGYVLHGQPYDETARVPLVLRGPGLPAGTRIPHLAGLVDLAPTLLSLLDFPIPVNAQGRDLTSLLRGGPPVRQAVFVDGIYEDGRTWGSSVVADVEGKRWSYVAEVTPRPGPGGRDFVLAGPGELYDLAADPEEQHDLATERPDLARRLGKRLVGWLRANEARAGHLRRAEAVPPVSPEEEAQLRALGYLDGGP
ncbi:MAG: sulfatase-like hydrolase/transferase [Myxococcota bacterium]|nr:sulfatase-like hydrolase/transferase [Myxococcota bacterium]